MNSFLKTAFLAQLSVVLLNSFLASAQSHQFVYRNTADSSFNSYLKIIPATDSIKGLVVRDFTNLPDMDKPSHYKFTDLCTEAGFMTLFTNTSNDFPELFITDEPMKLLESMILEVLEAHPIPKENIFIGGISASGARALRFAQYCELTKSKVKINGVFSVDSPLDLERFYFSATRHKKFFKAGMLAEANFMIPKFETWFDGPPKDNHAYRKASVFSHQDTTFSKEKLLMNTSLILFHEPDINWWIHERGASYYDINAFDNAAFTTRMKSLNHPDIQLVTTSNKGYNKNGERRCHSWSIVDEPYLVKWMLDRIE